VGVDMGRCGNNINQLAKYANILKKRGMLSPVVIERFNVLFEQYLKNQQALDVSLRKVFRMTAV
jgi:Bacterial mobilisation protein (MobC)